MVCLQKFKYSMNPYEETIKQWYLQIDTAHGLEGGGVEGGGMRMEFLQ